MFNLALGVQQCNRVHVAINMAIECRKGCGACCIAPSISQAIPGMPQGKKAGERCINLLADSNLCQLWGTDQYPSFCRAFTPEPWVCGDTNEQALIRLIDLEQSTSYQK